MRAMSKTSKKTGLGRGTVATPRNSEWKARRALCKPGPRSTVQVGATVDKFFCEANDGKSLVGVIGMDHKVAEF